MGDKLPENIVQLSTFRINRGKEKHCSCYEWMTFPKKPLAFEFDPKNREVFCRHCGNKIDAFDAMLLCAEQDERRNSELKQLFEQAKELSEYKPWLIRAREFERELRAGMIPICPHCSRGILPEELTRWGNKERELQARKFQKQKEES
ncbi:hypothetical protein [Acetonema longum]|uniref:Uncharacterized protein n=1 Tax=Acetonema longum DSM 6540 TaxID=1009370 RepID=F7NKB3_9FIRM|nr:hypothetical protein [Acetonema longum]EGO63554.1 hypothetical protein ALO_12631 [Acetonema longum DSM 6540]